GGRVLQVRLRDEDAAAALLRADGRAGEGDGPRAGRSREARGDRGQLARAGHPLGRHHEAARSTAARPEEAAREGRREERRRGGEHAELRKDVRRRCDEAPPREEVAVWCGPMLAQLVVTALLAASQPPFSIA